MLRRYNQILNTTFRLVDLLVIMAAWILAYWLRFSLQWIPVTKGFPEFSTYAALLPVIVAVWTLTFSATDVYRSKRMLRRTHEVHLLLKSHGIALLIFIALTYLFSNYRYSRGVVIQFGIVGALGLIFFRLILRNFLREIRRKGYNLRHVLIVGEGGSVQTLIQRMDKFPEMGLRVAGILTTEKTSDAALFGKPVIGTISDLEAKIESIQPDQILIALPRSRYHELNHVLSSIHDSTCEIRLIPDVHEYVALGCEVENFEGIPIVNLNSSPLDGWGVIIKRVLDILLSAAALIVLAPVFVVLGVLIKLSSKGPVLYKQERMGMDGKPFMMLKFRSMRTDAEAESGAVWAKEKDPRRTALGAFLRSTSLDELPQFWNVLVGEMSLVGPRPERAIFVRQFKKEIPNYMLRHKVKAGITGWAQINGWRGNTSLEKRIEYDLFYIQNWSISFDFRILFMTLFKGFVNRNAY